MVTSSKLMKTKWFPRVHNERLRWGYTLESATANNYTIMPICMYDEGQGSPSAQETNPENALFTTTDSPAVFPDSTVEQIYASFRMDLSKLALETDKIHALRYCYMPIMMNFKEDYTAIDELSQLETQDILNLETESTDRQGFPLWNDIDMPVVTAAFNILDVTVPGLDTTQAIEGVAFDPASHYNTLQFLTISGKYKTLQGGLKWRTLTKDHPTEEIRFKFTNKTKRANEFMFAGMLIGVPPVDDFNQIPIAAETTNVTHVHCTLKYRYNEWNQDFNFKLV